jgi:hypothetical protein
VPASAAGASWGRAGRAPRRAAIRCATLAVLAGLLAGCAAKRDPKAAQVYMAELDADVGTATIEKYVRNWGTPSQRIDLPDGTIYCWRISHGAKSGGVGYIVSYGESYERYDDLRLTFDKEAVLREYAVDCYR